MFSKDLVAAQSGARLDGNDSEAVRSIALRQSYVLGYVETEVDSVVTVTYDGGAAATAAALDLLTSDENKWLRQWLSYWRQLGPGWVQVRGGDDGVIYDAKLELDNPEIEICRLAFRRRDPIDNDADLGFGFS